MISKALICSDSPAGFMQLFIRVETNNVNKLQRSRIVVSNALSTITFQCNLPTFNFSVQSTYVNTVLFYPPVLFFFVFIIKNSVRG